MRIINRCNLYVWILSLLLGTGLVEGQQMYDLGTLGDGTQGSVPAAINSHGQVVGKSYPVGATDAHAFLWTPGATDGVPSNPQMKDLGTLGGFYSEATAINDSGQVAGIAGLPDGQKHAFLWTPGGTGGSAGNPQMEDLGIMGCCTPVALNARGQVIEEGPAPPLLWTPGGTDGVAGNPQLKNLGTLGGGCCTTASGINDSGQVSGSGWVPDDPHTHAFLWTQGGTDGIAGNPQMKDLGTLGGSYSSAGPNESYSDSRPINVRGQVAGYSSLAGDTAFHAFLWTPGATDGISGNPQMKDIGMGSTDAPIIVNDNGQVAGTVFPAGAFLWTPGGTGGSTGNPQLKVLGTLGGSASEAWSMNSLGRVVGISTLPNRPLGSRLPLDFGWNRRRGE